MLREILEFQGTWRSYQKRVLDRFDAYMQNGKIHIAAAPGSGKTTLGIELIRRIDRPVLILAPTLTIREQWVRRIREAFLTEPEKAEEWISQDLKAPRPITVSTYQALHSAVSGYAGVLKENDEFGTEEVVDYAGFDVTACLKEMGLGTLCLDECHHLRSEWWKALELLKKDFPSIYTVALTATPPYDSAPAMWDRYISLCGEIDEEISVPELVKDGTLCPHQDFVYFNYPTREEMKEVKAFRQRVKEIMSRFLEDEVFRGAVKSHPFLTGRAGEEEMLEKPEYLSSMLVFLEASGEPWPKACQKLLGFKNLEPLSEKWMEILLQGFFYEDAASYQVPDGYQEERLREMKAAGAVEKKKVSLLVNGSLEKTLVNSAGKCGSIRNIVLHEYENMGTGLRLLVLADYIRKEYESALGDASKNISSLGVLPFFEQIRREAAERKAPVRLGVLCGSIVIIPEEAKERLLALAERPEKIRFARAGQLPDYWKAEASGDRHFLMGPVTRLFEEGYIQVLIGTKSLLGEGWDAPCVNSLILASFVGSYMLSNQMRGRAIRVFREEPEKTSTVWHLVCVKPGEESEDFAALERRMEHFLGLHYEKDQIENGIGRLTAIQKPFTKQNVERTNERMLELSGQRALLKERWDRSLAVSPQIETVSETGIRKKDITGVALYDVIRDMVIKGVLTTLAMFICIFLVRRSGRGVSVHMLQGVYGILLAVLELPGFRKLYTLGSPMKRLRVFGEGIRQALEETGQLDAPGSRAETESEGVYHLVYLWGGTERDKTLFTKCVNEFFEVIHNQRYLLYKRSRKNRMDGYFAVPECFARRKEDARIFADCMSRFLGRYEPVYTRNEGGRKILLAARRKAFSNREHRCVTREKVKGALE